MENYAPNSHKYKGEQKEAAEVKKRAEKVITGKATSKKKSGVAKLAEIFVPEDVTNVREYVVSDILIPAVKKAISDVVDICLYGEPGHSKRSSSGGSKVSYGRYYEKRDDKPHYSSRARSGYDFDDIVLDNRGDAEEVLDALDDILEQYHMVSVADLYDLVGIESKNYLDHKRGWTDLHTAKVLRAGDGYLLKLPKAMPID